MTDQTSGDPRWRPPPHPQASQFPAPPPSYVYEPPAGYTLKKKKKKKKKPFYKRVWFWLLAIIVVIIIVIIASVASTANNAVNRAHTVVYTVASDANTAESITYLNIHGDGTSGQEQATNVALPWSKTVNGKGDTSSFTLTAQASQTATKISCQIKIDGVVKADQTSTGQFTVVTCNATPSTAGTAATKPAPTATSTPPSAEKTSPAEQSLAERQQRLSAETGEPAVLVQVPAGFQAATYDQSGHIQFWFESTAGSSWLQIGQSRYPATPELGPPDAVAMGALLRRMSDATFIVRGLFSGDGSGNAVAFTGGPRGWGLIKAEPNGNIGPSGEPLGADRIGLSYDFAFRDGLLETRDCPTDQPTYQCSAHPIVKLWEWQTNDFTRVS